MAGGRVYGGSDMAAILQNEGLSTEAIEALLASTSPSAFHGSRSTLNFGDIHGSTPERSFFRLVDMEEAGNDDLEECFHQPEKKRRLTSNQVQFLEKSFETENKLEPERKLQLARDLGLQPRQVAIWFQNRRARWKTKQLEKDYETLKQSYGSLKGDHDNLIKEKEKLKAEVLALSEKLLHKESEQNHTKASDPKQPDSVSASEERKPEVPMKACKQEEICSAQSAIVDSDSSHYTDGGGQYSPQLEPADSSNVFQPDHSDLSNAEDDDVEKACRFPKLEDNSCNYGFPVEDHALWLWPY